MKKFQSIAFLASFLSVVGGDFGKKDNPKKFVCPNGGQTTSFCFSNKRDSCNNAALCTIYDNYAKCCDKTWTHCTETGMHGFIPGFYKFFDKIDWREVRAAGGNVSAADDMNKSVWYLKLDNPLNQSLRCPYPYSFQLYNTVEENRESILPVGFELGKVLKMCETSLECQEDEFCGPAYNPSYCNVRNNVDFYGYYYSRGCMDISVGEQPARFCYKAPTKLTVSFSLIHNAYKIVLCKNHSGCASIPDSVCATMDVSMYQEQVIEPHRYKYNQNRTVGISVHGKTGMCGRVKVCNPRYHISMFGKVGRNETYCREKKDCETGHDCVIAHQFWGQGFCCERRKEIKRWPGKMKRKKKWVVKKQAARMDILLGINFFLVFIGFFNLST